MSIVAGLAVAITAAGAACGLSTQGAEDTTVVQTQDGAPETAGPDAGTGEVEASSIPDAAIDATGDETSPDAATDAPRSDAPPDGPIDAPIEAPPPPTVIAFVQAGQSTHNGATTFTVPNLSPTKAGDFLAVLVSQDSDTATTVTSVTDNASGGTNTYASANLRAVGTGCNQAVEIWYARNVHAGATMVTVDVSSNVDVDVWVVEFSGLAPTGGPEVGMTGASSNAMTIVAPAPMVTAVPSAVVSVVGSCSSVVGLHPGNPFTALPSQHGNDAAYFIAMTPGAYGPVFDNQKLDGWNGSTAAFR